MSWSEIEDRHAEPVEFGACHVNCAWRRHRSAQHKFKGLESALRTSQHSLLALLQNLGGNPNARNYAERGPALFAAVWFADQPWAILCSPTEAVLVEREHIETITPIKERDDDTVNEIRALFDQADQSTRRPLNRALYDEIGA